MNQHRREHLLLLEAPSERYAFPHERAGPRCRRLERQRPHDVARRVERAQQRRSAAGQYRERACEPRSVDRDDESTDHRHSQQRALPGMETPLPPTVRRRLKEHLKEVDSYFSFLDRRLQFDKPNVEPLGVLPRVPAKEVK